MEPWNEQMAHEFSIYKYFTWPVGTWPLAESQNLASFRVFVVVLLQASLMAGMASDIIGSELASIDVVIDHFTIIAGSFLAMSKLLLLRRHRHRLARIVNCASVDWTSNSSCHFQQIMSGYADLGRLVFFCQMIFSYFTVAVIVLAPLGIPDFVYNSTSGTQVENDTVLHAKLLPLGSVCVYRDNESTYCDALYTLRAIELTSTCTANIGTDVFLYGLAFHLCGQFEILAHNMLKFGETRNTQDEREKVVGSIERHSVLLELASSLEVTGRLILLVLLLTNSLYICFTGFQLIGNIRARDFGLLTRTIASFVVIMLQLFLWCYVGESLSSRIEDIIEAVYLSNWCSLPASTIRDLSFVIARARVPFSITAGTVCQFSLNNFKNIVKASISYISVLQLAFEG